MTINKTLDWCKRSIFEEIEPYIVKYLTPKLSDDGSIVVCFSDAPLISQMYYFLILDLQEGHVFRCKNKTCNLFLSLQVVITGGNFVLRIVLILKRKGVKEKWNDLGEKTKRESSIFHNNIIDYSSSHMK